MSADKAKLHIEGGTDRVEAIRGYLDLIDRYEYDSVDDVMDDIFRNFGLDAGQTAGKEMQTTLAKLGLVEDGDRQTLTDRGEALVEAMLVSEELFYELLHFEYATAYHRNPGPETGISWSYYHICDEYRRRSPVEFTSAKQSIIEAVRDAAETGDEAFGEVGALSGKSLNGFRKFIEPLSPPVIDGGEVVMRESVKPELMLAAIDHLYRTDSVATTDYNGPLPLDGDVSDALCTICLLDEAALTDVVEHTATVDGRLELTSDYSLRVRLSEQVNIDALC